MQRKAVISKCKTYRYMLSRIWDSRLPIVLFIGLNPSTADQVSDDPTVRRLIGFTERWQYGGFYLCNLFGYRTAHPKELKEAEDPIGPYNNKYIKEYQKKVSKTILMYGNDGSYLNRHLEVQTMILTPYCIEMSKKGMPKHPLYLKYSNSPIPFSYKIL